MYFPIGIGYLRWEYFNTLNFLKSHFLFSGLQKNQCLLECLLFMMQCLTAYLCSKDKNLVFCPFAVELESNSSKHGKAWKHPKKPWWKASITVFVETDFYKTMHSRQVILPFLTLAYYSKQPFKMYPESDILYHFHINYSTVSTLARWEHI